MRRRAEDRILRQRQNYSRVADPEQINKQVKARIVRYAIATEGKSQVCTRSTKISRVSLREG